MALKETTFIYYSIKSSDRRMVVRLLSKQENMGAFLARNYDFRIRLSLVSTVKEIYASEGVIKFSMVFVIQGQGTRAP